MTEQPTWVPEIGQRVRFRPGPRVTPTIAGKVARVVGRNRWASGGPYLLCVIDPDDEDDPWICCPEDVDPVAPEEGA